MGYNCRLKIIRASTIPGSLNNFCRGILSELKDKYEVVAVSSPGPALLDLAEREGVRTIAIPMERHISPWNDFISLCRMVRVFIKEKPDMVHSMTPKAGLICMMAGWLTRVPLRVHTFTGLVWPTSTGLKRKILMFTDILTCACATHVIPEGEGVKNDLINGGITKKPLKVLGYGSCKGVDLAYFQMSEKLRAKSEKLRKPGTFTFLYVGRLVRDKGINELVEAFVKLHQENSNTRLWLVGRLEDSLDSIKLSTKAMIEDANNGTESVGPKYEDDLLEYYAASDCLVLPSYREGFPNTPIEAGAMGLPCIVTDINGSREIIADGENGFVVPPQDADKLYEAMSRIVHDKEKREAMAANARPMISKRFEASFVRACLYDFYNEILKGERRTTKDEERRTKKIVRTL